jgi:hypothetical protein
VWTKQARLTALDGGEAEFFGYSLALDGDTLAVGSLLARDGGDRRPGAAYVFRRTGTSWRLEARISPAALSAGAQFGNSISLTGDRLAVGAHFDDRNPNDVASGSAWVFSRTGSTWKKEAFLTGDAGVSQFGEMVSLGGDTLAVGAFPDRAYVFRRGGGAWTPEARLTRGDDPAAYAFFGFSAAVGPPAGDLSVILGDRKAPEVKPTIGAYLFARNGDGAWSRLGLLNDHLQPYGPDVVIEGDTIVLGSPQTGDSGEVDVYTPLVDLAVRLLVPAPSIAVEHAFAYRARVFNRGILAAGKTVLKLDLPPGVTLVAARPERGSCGTGNPVVCELGTLAPGESVLVTVEAIAGEPGAKTATATVSASRPDANPADNSASATVTFIVTAAGSGACGNHARSCGEGGP